MPLVVVTHSEPVRAALEQPGQPVIIGFFSAESATCRDARPAFERSCASRPQWTAYLVDVTVVPYLHPTFDVSELPTVVLVRDGKVLQRIVGARDAAFYTRALRAPEPAGPVPEQKRAGRTPHVVVYTTDGCPWCAQVKAYLRQHQIRFREIDVQRDPVSARRMVERSGRQGVPQIDIGGHMVVGFAKAQIDALLGLRAACA